MGVWFGYYLAKLQGKIFGNRYKYINAFFKKRGVIFSGGGQKPPIICCNIAKNEPYLISIGDDTVISGNVELITHDYSISRLGGGMSDLFGKISTGCNCFIGNGAIIMYGVSMCNNVIVAAGSVVTKSIMQEKVIVAGNPAKIIGTWEDFEHKHGSLAWIPSQISKKELIHQQIIEDKFLVKK